MKIGCYLSILSLTFISLSGDLLAQVGGCGTVVSVEQIALEKTINIAPSKSNESLPLMNRELSVTIHVVRDQNGLDGITSIAIQNAIEKVNLAFSPIKLSFRICAINYITNYQFNTINSAVNESDLLVQNYSENTINLYFATTLIDKFGSEVCGYSLMPSAGKDAVFMEKDCVNSTELIHQFGHLFSLYHTHETIFDKELVNDIKCNVTGDKCCDTPADPYLVGLADSNCEYLGSLKDSKGQFYVPSMKNYMSFSNDICRCAFSNDQFLRIINCLLNNKKHLW